MPFKRRVVPELMTGETLTAAMAGIGMEFYSTVLLNMPIEDVLISASVEGMERDDLRVLSVLMTWLDVHHPWVNADRLIRGAQTLELPRTRAFWAAVSHWLKKDRRFAKLRKLHRGAPIDLLPTGMDFQIERKGEDPRFVGSPLRVPAQTLRDRSGDVSTPAELAARHDTYRRRILMGPSYRADMWAALERNPDLTASQLAHETYGSFATAWAVKQDFGLLRAAQSAA